MSNLDAKFDGIAYIGRKTLRSDDEPVYRGNDRFDSREEYISMYPEAVPHVFVKCNEPISFREALMSPSKSLTGSSSVLVSYQKEVRDKSTPAEVDAWRNSFEPSMLDGQDVEMLDGKDTGELELMNEINNGAPFVILTNDDISLDVPKQPEDMRRVLKDALEGTSLEGNFGDLDEKSDAEIRNLYESLQSLVN